MFGIMGCLSNNDTQCLKTRNGQVQTSFYNLHSFVLRNSDDEKYKKSSQALLVSLINVISMFAMSKTELLCYLIIFIHTALNPTILSLTLPLLVFMWGSLTTIRPTPTFWTVLIAYTEVCLFIWRQNWCLQNFYKII